MKMSNLLACASPESLLMLMAKFAVRRCNFSCFFFASCERVFRNLLYNIITVRLNYILSRIQLSCNEFIISMNIHSSWTNSKQEVKKNKQEKTHTDFKQHCRMEVSKTQNIIDALFIFFFFSVFVHALALCFFGCHWRWYCNCLQISI